MPRGRAAAPRARASLSLESVVDAAIELLDTKGESGLTFRALAMGLGGGVGSIYWYVNSKEELLDLATDAVVARVLKDIERLPDDDTTQVTERLAALRLVGLALFKQLEQHPWAARYLMRDSVVQVNSLRYFELVGRQLLPLDLTASQRFHAASTIVNFVVGTGGQMAYQSHPLDDDGQPLDQTTFLHDTVDTWLALDKDEFPFLHDIADVFATHDDFDQFTAGLDLVIAGIGLLAHPS